MKQRPSDSWGSECLAGLPNDRRYLVGVSGGRDSVALLHRLAGRGYRKLIVCHLEHGLRGYSGKADAHFVERLAQEQGLKFELGIADVASIATRTKQSIETVARHQRLAFFTRVARRRRCLTIFLAHHADDQVETFLMNLFRGAGGRGLGAMRPSSSFGPLQIVRPLLGVWRSGIDGYCQEHRLKFREDVTNEELRARRNRMRHQIIPYLEKVFGRNVRATIWRAATVLAEEEDFLETLTPPGLTKGEELNVAQLRLLPPALQRRAIRNWLTERSVPNLGFALVDAVRGLLVEGAPARLNLPRGGHARRRAGKIFLE
jgi:tRNA(Ile)-lysidine synthase